MALMRIALSARTSERRACSVGVASGCGPRRLAPVFFLFGYRSVACCTEQQISESYLKGTALKHYLTRLPAACQTRHNIPFGWPKHLGTIGQLQAQPALA